MVIDLSNSSYILTFLVVTITLQVLSFWIGHIVGQDKWNFKSFCPGLFIMLFIIFVAVELALFFTLGSTVTLTR